MKNLRCYARISIDNLIHNLSCIRRVIGDDKLIFPIVKADAYSHGDVRCAKAMSDAVHTFAVAEINEALHLRENGIENDILILGYTDPSFAALLCENKITQTVTDKEYAKALSESLGKGVLGIHLKVDTGMHRFGIDCEGDGGVAEAEEIAKLPNLEIKGTFSHFAESDYLSSPFTDLQFSRFIAFTEKLHQKGIDTGILHVANSGATLTRPDTHLMAVRPGIILYGAYPSREVKEKYLSLYPDYPLKEVMTMCARVGQVHKVKKGEGIGYSRTFVAEGDMTVATVTAGYADGIPRGLSNKGKVTINGEVFPIVGNVCMDLLMVDITNAKNPVKAGDEVIFWGEEGLSIDEYANDAGEINYTVYTGVSPRVKRIYK